MNVTTNEDLIAAKTRLTNAQADVKELQLGVLRKDYVKREDVLKQWGEQVSRVRQKILSLPVRLAGMLAHKEYLPAEIESLSQGLVNEALQELAEEFVDNEE